MKTQLTTISQQKTNRKTQLTSLKNKYIAIIYGGLAKNQSLTSIHKRLYDETINSKRYTDKTMLKHAVATADRVYHSLQEDVTPLLVYLLISRLDTDRRLTHDINVSADKYESNAKLELLENPKEVFYIASSHKDCAKDHLSAQGKIYVNENWRSLIKNKELRNKIDSYIKSHGTQTLQYITGKPVYFITRPNCRHYFSELSVEEVLGSSVKSLLKKHNMTSEIGNRQYLQTMKVRNIEKYKERLDLHEKMYKEMKTEILAKAIAKDKFLINKWRKEK